MLTPHFFPILEIDWLLCNSVTTTSTTACSEDWLEIYILFRDGNDRFIGRYCGATSPGPVESPRFVRRQHMQSHCLTFVLMLSSIKSNLLGWLLAYEFICIRTLKTCPAASKVAMFSRWRNRIREIAAVTTRVKSQMLLCHPIILVG